MITCASFARGLAASAAFVLALAAPPAPVAATPQISGATWVETVAKTCANASSCNLLFTAVPAGKTLIARNISCRIIIPSSAVFFHMYLHNTPIGRPVYLNPGPVSVFGTSKQYVFSTQIFEPFAGNQSPTIVFRLYASSVTAFSLSCTLAGELS